MWLRVLARRTGLAGRPTIEIGTAQHYRWLQGVLVAVLLLNLVDTVLTVFWVSVGVAVEANPLMDVLFARSPALFAAAKTVLVCGGCYVLWAMRQHRWAVVSIFVAFIAYYGVAIQHVEGIVWATLHALERVAGWG